MIDSDLHTHLIARSFIRILQEIREFNPEMEFQDPKWIHVFSKLDLKINENLICNIHRSSSSSDQELSESSSTMTKVAWDELVALIPHRMHVEVFKQGQQVCHICSEIPSVWSSVSALTQNAQNAGILSRYINQDKTEVFTEECVKILHGRQDELIIAPQTEFR